MAPLNAAELSGTPAFGGLDAEPLERVAACLREEHFEAEDVVVKEGDPADRMYVIRAGSVEVLKAVKGALTIDRRIATLKPGDCFGEMALIDIQPRSATVRALEPTQLWSLSNANLHELREWNTEVFALIMWNLAREISRRLRRVDAVAAEFFLYEG